MGCGSFLGFILRMEVIVCLSRFKLLRNLKSRIRADLCSVQPTAKIRCRSAKCLNGLRPAIPFFSLIIPIIICVSLLYIDRFGDL